MENIIHTFKNSNLFEVTTIFFKHLNISTQTFEKQAFLPQDFLKNLYKPEKQKKQAFDPNKVTLVSSNKKKRK